MLILSQVACDRTVNSGYFRYRFFSFRCLEATFALNAESCILNLFIANSTKTKVNYLHFDLCPVFVYHYKKKEANILFDMGDRLDAEELLFLKDHLPKNLENLILSRKPPTKSNNYSSLSTFFKNYKKLLDILPNLYSVLPMITTYNTKAKQFSLVSKSLQDNCSGSMRLGTAAKTFIEEVVKEVKGITSVSKKSLESLLFYKSLKGSQSFTNIIKNSKKSTTLVTLWKQGMFLKNEFAVEGESTK